MALNLNTVAIRREAKRVTITIRDIGDSLAKDLPEHQAGILLAFAQNVREHWKHPNPLTWRMVCVEVAGQFTPDEATLVSDTLGTLIEELDVIANEENQSAEIGMQ